MTTDNLLRPKLKMLKPDDLRVDPEVQRRVSDPWADAIAANLNPRLIGTICVSHRNDGHYYVVDGQHRVLALIRAGRGDKPIACNVYEGLSTAEEAAWYVGLGDVRRAHPIDIFRLRTKAEDPIAVAIAAIVSEYGLAVGFDSRDGVVSAVGALEHVYLGKGGPRTGIDTRPDVLRLTLGIINEAWGKKRAAYDGLIIKGVGKLVLRHPDIDVKRVVSRLAQSGSPEAIIGQAKSVKEVLGGDLPTAVAELVIAAYNKGLRTNQLPSIKRAA